jgi:hypothetical protein
MHISSFALMPPVTQARARSIHKRFRRLRHIQKVYPAHQYPMRRRSALAYAASKKSVFSKMIGEVASDLKVALEHPAEYRELNRRRTGSQ